MRRRPATCRRTTSLRTAIRSPTSSSTRPRTSSTTASDGAYARIIARANSPTERRALAAEYAAKRRISAERVDPIEVASIVAEAANARNGWKVILVRCAATTKPRSALQLAREMIAAHSPSRR